MAKRIQRHFDVVWWLIVAGIFAVGLMPFALPWAGWQWVALVLLILFVIVEYLSKAVGRSTLTAWVHWYLRDHRWARIWLGIFFALVCFVRLPDVLNVVMGVYFFAWLPPHYSEPGFRGMVDEFFYRAFGVRLW